VTRRLVRKSETAKAEPEVEAEAEEEEESQLEEWNPTPLLYNVTDACVILGKISKGMLYRYINSHEIEPLKLGTRSVFTMKELERFVTAHEQKTS
jgi:hypothetical protein